MKKTNKQHHGTGLCCSRVLRFLGNIFFSLDDKELEGLEEAKQCFISQCVLSVFYQPMDKKIKTWTLSFPAKENPNMEKALLNWPIVSQYDIKAISRKFFVHEVFSTEHSLNQPKATHVCIRSTS